jgi:hypothetical protein
LAVTVDAAGTSAFYSPYCISNKISAQLKAKTKHVTILSYLLRDMVHLVGGNRPVLSNGGMMIDRNWRKPC